MVTARTVDWSKINDLHTTTHWAYFLTLDSNSYKSQNLRPLGHLTLW